MWYQHPENGVHGHKEYIFPATVSFIGIQEASVLGLPGFCPKNLSNRAAERLKEKGICC